MFAESVAALKGDAKASNADIVAGLITAGSL